MYLLLTEQIEDDFGSHCIDIPIGKQKPRNTMDESNLEGSYYNRVALNWTNDEKLKLPE